MFVLRVLLSVGSVSSAFSYDTTRNTFGYLAALGSWKLRGSWNFAEKYGFQVI
jgi:hypothetical protein